MLTNNELMQIKTASIKQSKIYDQICRRLDLKSNLQSFIHDVLCDYVYDINDGIIDCLDNYIPSTWPNASAYINELNDSIKHVKNAVINVYIVYYDHVNELNETCLAADDSNLDANHYISDVSTDYYNEYLGGNIISEPSNKAILQLKHNGQLDMLIAILAKLNLTLI